MRSTPVKKMKKRKKNLKNLSPEMANILSNFEGWGPTKVFFIFIFLFFYLNLSASAGT